MEGNYNKISGDLLQLACGHRADIIEQRRDAILKSVKDKFMRSNLRKIPPSSSFLFNKEAFSSAIEKAGGAGKVFWPLRNAQKSSWAAAQAGSSSIKVPAQGFHFQGPKGPYGRLPQSQSVCNALPYQPYYAHPGMPSMSNHYPTQGFNYPPQGYKRFPQNHYKVRTDSIRNSRPRANFDDNGNKSQSKHNNKNFRSKRKF